MFPKDRLLLFFKFATIDHAQVVPMEVLDGGGGQGDALGRGTEIGLWAKKSRKSFRPFSPRLLPTWDMLPTGEVGAFS